MRARPTCREAVPGSAGRESSLDPGHNVVLSPQAFVAAVVKRLASEVRAPKGLFRKLLRGNFAGGCAGGASVRRGMGRGVIPR
jgi:hypothetical protein